MNQRTAIEELDIKITLILERYELIKEENRKLKETISINKETEAELRNEILKLREEEELKELEIEDIAKRISQTLGEHSSFQQISA